MDEEIQSFINLPLMETGRRFLQCVLWTEGVGRVGKGPGGDTGRFRRFAKGAGSGGGGAND